MENIEKLKDKPMTNHHKEVLRRNRVLLTDDIDPEVICNYLLQEGIITPHTFEEILENRVTRRTRNSFLLNILESRSDAAFYCLLKALKEGSGQTYLVKALERDDANKSIKSKGRLRQSNSLPNVFPVQRVPTRKLSMNDLKPASEESDEDSSESETSSDDSDVADCFLSDVQFLSDIAASDEEEEDDEEAEDEEEEEEEVSVFNTSASSTDSNDSQPKIQPVISLSAVNRNNSASSLGKGKSEAPKPFLKAELVPLPSVTSLFRFVAPHVHSRWKELAYELGLTDEHIGGIHVIPFDRPSKYATTVLEKWAKLNKGKATKAKLTETLAKMNIKKALDTIERYKISPVNPPRTRRRSQEDTPTRKKEVKVAFTLFDEEKNNVSAQRSSAPPVKTVKNRKRTVVPKPQLKVPKRQKGEIQARCELKNEGATHGERVFLDMAPRILEAMIQQGDQAKDILNNLKELRGIVCTDIRKGSIIVVLVPFTVNYMEHLQDLYDSGELKAILAKVFFTPELKDKFHLQGVDLQVGITKENFDECRNELQTIVKAYETAKENKDGNCTPETKTDVDQADILEESGSHDPFVQKLFHGLGNLNQYIADMTRCLALFESSCSEFLLTLSLIQPANVLLIRNLTQLNELHKLSMQSKNVQVRPDLLQQYLNLYGHFKSKVRQLEEDIYSNIKDKMADCEVSSTVVRHHGTKVIDVFDELKIMLDFDYDFSGLSHPNLPKLVMREMMSYKGLLSYLLVLCDMLKAGKKKLRKLLKHL